MVEMNTHTFTNTHRERQQRQEERKGKIERYRKKHRLDRLGYVYRVFMCYEN